MLQRMYENKKTEDTTLKEEIVTRRECHMYGMRWDGAPIMAQTN